MKPLLNCLLLFAALLSNTISSAQETASLITEDDYNRIIPFLIKEDWKETEKISLEFLKRFKGANEMSDDAGIIRYMYLTSVSGLLGNKEIDKEAALKKLKGFEGKNVITPYNMFKKGGMFNYFSLDEESKNWLKCSANDKATTIYAFETFEMADQDMVTNYQQFEGRNMRVSAIIKSIGASGYTMPRLDIRFTNTDIWDMEE
ncbi:hypothetical protein HYN59_11120 [Flavobacterium album]|uniref:DUF4919 domain-containing protein n=1 Tax=Flavobacterium album TaxID=2175091 RepID=A0A2S1QZ16_9FLAO|nr:hypothetical protein [Flavobacterium album]AWH85622.1 hypothetical protein HYN59_11120 [Flavobacterium album]